MQTKRRWLKSALQAASQEEVMLPWAAKRIQREAKPTPEAAPIIRIYPSAPTKYGAIAAC